MPDSKYCYPNTNILKNKLNIQNSEDLFNAEKELTLIRLQELQLNPIRGDFSFKHLKEIHQYIFQDVYDWAGKVRTVEIGKGNLFCTIACIDSYADSVFNNYYSQCFTNKSDFDKFVNVFADNYGNLNALHPFREGNGRTQREFARLVCLDCGYAFDLSSTTHSKMLEASILSFDKADSSLFCEIFRKAIIPLENYNSREDVIRILTSDDLTIKNENNYYDYYSCDKNEIVEKYDEIYKEKSLKLSQTNNKPIDDCSYNDRNDVLVVEEDEPEI
jgi:cell filamentation protein